MQLREKVVKKHKAVKSSRNLLYKYVFKEIGEEVIELAKLFPWQARTEEAQSAWRLAPRPGSLEDKKELFSFSQ